MGLCGSLWVVVGRCGSLWVVPCFSNYLFIFVGGGGGGKHQCRSRSRRTKGNLLTFCALSLSTLSNFYFTPICANLESDVTADVMCNKLYILCKGCAANQYCILVYSY